MARIFITGSADGLGLAAARTLLADGHQVVIHARSPARLSAISELLAQGAASVIGDLADFKQTCNVAEQVNALGKMDAVIHNAGVYSGAAVLPVNVIAPYLLTVLIQRPQRLIYLSSAMHLSGQPNLDSINPHATCSYSDSKLFVTTLAAAIARRWPDTYSNAVNPGWVPTKMGGANAPDDLRLGHLTQEWLATSNDAAARTSGSYWYHQQRDETHPAVHEVKFQERLLGMLAQVTGYSV
jgi:NAD(P)-dependent dehydrogenase (short-subunit alcohol dehydrogenase family)